MGRMFRSKFHIETGFYIILALSLLVIPFPWVLGWCFAVFFHELCHYLVLKLFRIPVFQIKMSAFGAQISAGNMTTGQEIICALAGPLGSLALLSVQRTFPYIALCAFGQLVFNLLPIYPLDGGRVLAGICLIFFDAKKGLYFSNIISIIFFIFLCVIFVAISFNIKLGVMPLLLILFVLFRIIKIPCKAGAQIVQ